MTNQRRVRGARQSGFNLVEVLIALLVLCIGLLGVAALQVQGVRFNYGSYSRSQAVVLANDYAERMYANRPGVDALAYAPFTSGACGVFAGPICGAQNGTTPAVCSAAQMAAYDQYVVACGYPIAVGRYGGVNDLLTAGVIQVQCRNAANTANINPCVTGATHQITVTWQENVTQADGSTALLPATFQMTVRP
jgi:type IV pilus assembly protein PilV